MIRKFMYGLSIGMLIVLFAYQIYIRFDNPKLTETELFINFWYIHLATILGCLFIVGYWNQRK